MKIDEIRGKTQAELEFELQKLRRELFDLRFKAATETSANPSLIRETRREIARIQTILRERATPSAAKARGQESR